MKFKRVNSEDSEFNDMIKELNKELRERYGELQLSYEGFNKVENLNTVVVGYHYNMPVVCGCLKEMNSETAEIKRLYVKRGYRQKGFAELALKELESWAVELGYSKTALETGREQPEAISLYKKYQYQIVPNFAPYTNMPNSVCMEKFLVN